LTSGIEMIKILKHLIYIALASQLVVYCSNKDEPAVVEEDLLPQEDLELINEPDEEISDAEINEANEGNVKDEEVKKADNDVKFATMPKKE